MSEPISPIDIPDYRRFWLARFLAVIAVNSIVVLVGYQVYDVARADYGMAKPEAAFQLGLLGLFQFVPYFLLTPLAGLAADRLDRRYVTAAASLVDLTIAVALAVFTWLDALSLPLLFGLAACHGAVRVFSGPAMSAIVPNIVPPALLPRAIAMSSSAWQVGAVSGPAAAGLIFAINPSLPFAIAAVLLLVSATLVLLIRPVRAVHVGEPAHPVRQIADGMRYTWNDRFLLGCITLDLFAVLLAGATAMLPVYARDILHVGPEGLGIMRAAPALGAAGVAFWLSFRPIEQNVGVKMLWAVVVFGLATIAFGLSRNFALSLATLVILGCADMVSVFIRSSLVQLNTPDEMRGRVSSISGLAISASNELGEMQSGIAAAILGATGAVVFGGAGAIVITGIWAWLFPELRWAKTFEPQQRHVQPDRRKTAS